MKIVWFSRHSPTPRQLSALHQSFGADLELVWDKKRFPSAAVLLKRFNKTHADDMVVVAPLSIIHALVQQGIHPLHAIIERCEPRHPHAEIRTSHQHYRFIQFERITSYTFGSIPITPATARLMA